MTTYIVMVYKTENWIMSAKCRMFCDLASAIAYEQKIARTTSYYTKIETVIDVRN